jgi:glyoxylase-like metal-dependent hydrolase (beta-lactamase superfamily II)
LTETRATETGAARRAQRDAAAPTALTERPEPACRRVARAATDAQARELQPGLWSLQLPLRYRSVSSVNAYLLRSDDGWIVWDCGSQLRPSWDAMELALDQAGVRPDEVAMLIASHSHADHRGLAAEFVARTGAILATSAEPHPLLDMIRDPAIPLEIRRDRARREGVPEFAVDGIVDELPGDDRLYPHAESDLVLEPGAVVQTHVGAWQVLALPGHGADQIGMFNSRLGYLLSADLAFDGVPSYLEYGTRPDPHADQLRSLQSAIALEPKLLLPGHGRPTPDAVTVLHRCRALVLGRVDRVLGVIDGSGLTAWDVAVALTPAGSLNDWYQRSLAEVLCVLEHLELEGRARNMLDQRGRRVWAVVEQ